MIGMVTAVLTGSAAGLLATIAASHSAVAGFVTGGVVGAAVLGGTDVVPAFGLGRRPTSNGSLRMSKKGQTRGSGQTDVPRCHVANTRWRPTFCAAADWFVVAVLATEIIAGAGFHK
jgi:hypothetical protein